MFIFTVCTINNLAHAFVLGDSIKTQHPEYQFVIGLVDNKSNIPTSIKSPYLILDNTEIEIPEFIQMAEKYTIDELSANCKPFFAEYFLEKTEKLIFLDCTSVIFQSITFVSDLLNHSNIVLTPQLLFANKHPNEKLILNSGIYHAGFIGFKKSDETFKFLKWWSKNTSTKGFKDLCKGLNTDQLWLEHVPAMYEGVYILKEAGVNIGYWNQSERNITQLKLASKLYSINYRDRQFPKEYIEKLNKYSQKKLSKIKPTFGIEDSNKPTLGKTIARKIRTFNNLVDLILDKFIS